MHKALKDALNLVVQQKQGVDEYKKTQQSKLSLCYYFKQVLLLQ